MKYFKYALIAFGALLALCVAAAVLVMVAFDTEDYRNALKWTLRHTLGYNVTVQGNMSLDISMDPLLSLSDVYMESDRDKGLRVSGKIGRLRLRFSLPLLLKGTIFVRELELDDFNLSLSGKLSHQKESNSKSSSRHLRIPLIQNAHLRNAQISYVAEGPEPMVLLVLSSVVIDGNKGGAHQAIAADGFINGTAFSVQGDLGSLDEALREVAPLPLDLSLKLSDLNARISGSIRDPLRGEGLDILLTAESHEISHIPGILGIRVPVLGSLRMSAAVTGTIAAPSLQALDIDVSGSQALRLAVRGSVGNLANGKGADLVFSAATSVDVIIAALLPRQFHGVSNFSVSGTMRESHGDLQLENLKVTMSERQRAEISGEGNIVLARWPDLTMKTGVLDLKLTALRTDELKPFLFSWFPDTGPVTAEARLRASGDILSIEDMRVRIGKSRQAQINGKGRIGMIRMVTHPTASDINLSISLDAKDVRVLFNRAGISIPALGHVNAVGRITGSAKNLEFLDVEIHTQDETGLAMDLTGMIRMEAREIGSPLWHLNIGADVGAPQLRSLHRLIASRALPTLGPVQLHARLSGTQESLMLKDIVATAGHRDSVLLEARGDSGVLDFTKTQPFSNLTIRGSLHAASLAGISQFTGISLPSIGPVEGSWRLVARDDGYGLEDLQLTLGHSGHTLVTLKGRIGQAMHGADVALDEVALALVIRKLEARAFEGLLGPGIARIGTIDGHLSVSGRPEDFALTDMDLHSLSPEGANIAIRGGVRHVRWKKDHPVQGIQMDMIARAPDTKVVRDVTGLALPDLGSLDAELLLRDIDGTLNISQFHVRTKTADMTTLLLEGKADDVTSPKLTTLKVKFETRTKPWIEALRHTSVEADYPLTGDFTVKGSRMDLQVKTLRILLDKGDLAEISASGYTKETNEGRELNLKVSSDIPDMAALGKAFGRELPSARPVKMSGRITGVSGELGFEGTVQAGSSHIDASLMRQTEENLPALSVRISSPKLILSDIGMSFRKTPDDAKRTQGSAGVLFGGETLPFESLKKLELSVSLAIGELVDSDLHLRDVDADLTLRGGILRLRRAGFTYADGYVSIESTINAAEGTPDISLHIEAEDVDSAKLLSHLRWPPMLRGHLNMLADLQSWGNSPRALASSLNGRIGLSIENGEIRKLADLAAADALDLAIAVGEAKEYKPLNCIAIVFDFEEGIGRSSVIYLDSPSVRTRGIGTVDLRQESLDVVLQPKSKTRLINISSAVTIKGPLRKPSVQKLPFVEAAQIYGDIFMPYVFLPIRALGYLWYIMKNDKDESSPCLTPSQLNDVEVR